MVWAQHVGGAAVTCVGIRSEMYLGGGTLYGLSAACRWRCSDQWGSGQSCVWKEGLLKFCGGHSKQPCATTFANTNTHKHTHLRWVLKRKTQKLGLHPTQQNSAQTGPPG